MLLNENYWMTTFGALEYDPEVFKMDRFKNGSMNGSSSPVSSVMRSQLGGGSGSGGSSPQSNARSYGSFDHLAQDSHFTRQNRQQNEASFREFLSKKV